MAASSTNRMRNRPFFGGERVGYFYIIPAFVFVICVLGFPILYSILISMQEFTLETLIGGVRPFIGLQNYREVLSDATFWKAVQHTLLFTVGSIFFQFWIGFGLALLYQTGFPGSRPMRGLILSAWLIPTLIGGTIFLWLLNLDFGLLNRLLIGMGIVKKPVGWLVEPDMAMISIIMANIWRGIPFNLLVLAAGISALPEDVYEAATVDGANGWQKLTRITLPLLRPTIFAVLMLGLIYTMRAFELVWLMTGGGPGDATEVMPTLAYRLGFVKFNFGHASTIATVMLCFLAIVALFYVRNAERD